MVDSGYVAPTHRVVLQGDPFVKNRNIGSATNMYAGRLVVRENSDYDVKVGDGILPPVGFLGYEQCNPNTRPATIDTIYTVDTEAPILHGGKFVVRGTLAKGTVAVQGDKLCSWGDGCVVPYVPMGGGFGIKIPFTKNTSLKDTSVDIPAGAIIKDCIVQVTTAVASGTIDVGLGAGTETGHDADGLIDGEDCATAGFRAHNMVDATAANNTLGVLLVESDLKTADATPLYHTVKLEPGLVCDGTNVSVDYTTSDHAIAGNIYVVVEGPGIVHVGKAGAAANASAAAVAVYVESDL